MNRIAIGGVAVGLAIVLPPKIAPLFPQLGVYYVLPAPHPIVAVAAAQEPIAPIMAATVKPLPIRVPTSTWNGYAMLEKAAACESTGDVNGKPRQFNDDGSILWGWDHGKIVKRDCGELQINTAAHADELKKLGLDVCNSEVDNLKYGKMLFSEYGMAPWMQSMRCWSGANSQK